MWETDPFGNSFGSGGLFLTLTELHKFGKTPRTPRGCTISTNFVISIIVLPFITFEYYFIYLKGNGKRFINDVFRTREC